MINWVKGCFDSNSKNVTFNVVSYNLCNATEFADCLFRFPKSMGNNLLSCTDQEIKDLGKKLLMAPEGHSLEGNKNFTIKEKELISDYAKMEYIQIGKKCLYDLYEHYHPGIFCFQEAGCKDVEKIDLFTKLQHEFGYTLIANGVRGKTQNAANGCMIAYDSKILKKNSEAFITQGNALCQDLVHLASKKHVRVVCDHVEGFNAITYRKNPAGFLPDSGDYKLEQTLNKIDDLVPDVIIYCLDSNTTVSGTGNDLHPARLKKLSDRNLIIDETDKTPTIRDANTNELFRYDYIFVKSIKGHVHIKNLPTNFLENNMSDHIPVVSKVELN